MYGDLMKKSKKKMIILIICAVILLVAAIIADRKLSKSYLVEIKYNTVMEKIENKDSFVLLLSQTTCSHCMEYKPKLENVANRYKVPVYYLEVDLISEEEKTELKKIFNFSGTPATIFVIDGEEKTAATRISGDASEEKITAKLKSNGFID